VRDYRAAATTGSSERGGEDSSEDSAAQDDVLSVMMAGRDDSGHGLIDTEPRDQMIILATAGMETTASAISWVSRSRAVDIRHHHPRALVREPLAHRRARCRRPRP